MGTYQAFIKPRPCLLTVPADGGLTSMGLASPASTRTRQNPSSTAQKSRPKTKVTSIEVAPTKSKRSAIVASPLPLHKISIQSPTVGGTGVNFNAAAKKRDEREFTHTETDDA